MMEPEVGRPTPPPAGDDSVAPIWLARAPRSCRFSVKPPTMLTVLTQTPPFRGLTAAITRIYELVRSSPAGNRADGWIG